MYFNNAYYYAQRVLGTYKLHTTLYMEESQ